jgi:hypothetical protein
VIVLWGDYALICRKNLKAFIIMSINDALQNTTLYHFRYLISYLKSLVGVFQTNFPNKHYLRQLFQVYPDHGIGMI